MKKSKGRWLFALMLGFVFCFSLSIQANAQSIKDNTAYRIIDVNSGRPLDVDGGEFGSGTDIQIWSKEYGKKNQMFFFETQGDYKVIKAAHSLKVVTVKKSSTKDFAPVVQWTDEGSKSMQWKAIDNGDGTVSFQNRNSGKMLDVSGGKTSKGTLLQQYTADGSDSQKFRLEEVSQEEMCDANLDSSHIIEPEPEKIYRIVNPHSQKVLDIKDMSTENGAPLQLWFKHEDNANQMFRFRSQGKGYYSIFPMHSHKALEVGGSSLELSAGINQWTHIDDYPTHMWKLIALADDTFILCNKNSGMVADIYSGDYTNGQAITQYNYNGTDAQIFRLEVIDKDEYDLFE